MLCWAVTLSPRLILKRTAGVAVLRWLHRFEVFVKGECAAMLEIATPWVDAMLCEHYIHQRGVCKQRLKYFIADSF